MVTKYNLFTVNKWIFTTLKSILYKKLTVSFALLCQNSPIFAFLQRFCLKLNLRRTKRDTKSFSQFSGNDYIDKLKIITKYGGV